MESYTEISPGKKLALTFQFSEEELEDIFAGKSSAILFAERYKKIYVPAEKQKHLKENAFVRGEFKVFKMPEEAGGHLFYRSLYFFMWEFSVVTEKHRLCEGDYLPYDDCYGRMAFFVVNKDVVHIAFKIVELYNLFESKMEELQECI